MKIPTKPCRICKKVLPLAEFSLSTRADDGLVQHCRRCNSLISRLREWARQFDKAGEAQLLEEIAELQTLLADKIRFVKLYSRTKRQPISSFSYTKAIRHLWPDV